MADDLPDLLWASRSTVAVVGPGHEDPELARIGHDVGYALGRAGLIVVCGGLGGVMAAAAAGCRAAGGTSVGLLPGHDRAGAAPDLTVAVPTGLGELRNGLVVRSAEAVIGIGGSWGTLSELALAMRLGLPVVVVRGWLVSAADGEPVDGWTEVATAGAAVSWVLDAVGG
jgi:hypothetical protein